MSSQKLRIGYIPEHFATPLHFAYQKFGLDQHVTLKSFPSGTGTLIEAFQKEEIDVGIGLTEAWIVGLSKSKSTKDKDDWSEKPYHLVGSYTMSPLTWAISGGKDTTMKGIDDLRGKKAGVSRMGSGSHIMSSVLAQKHGWLQKDGSMPFEIVVCGPFAPLRDAVNAGKADFFMWEHFTTKRYWASHGSMPATLKRVGEIETPWNAWYIAALGPSSDPRIAEHLLPALEKGIEEFQTNKPAAVAFIAENMEYSKEDAEAWYEGVSFAGPQDLRSIDPEALQHTVEILDTAGVLGARRISSHKDLQSQG